MSTTDRFRGVPLAQRKELQAMTSAYSNLRNAGWSEPMYIPDDLDEIQAIEAGSCGVFVARRVRLEEDRSIWFSSDGQDEYPCRPLLWRRVPAPPHGEGDVM